VRQFSQRRRTVAVLAAMVLWVGVPEWRVVLEWVRGTVAIGTAAIGIITVTTSFS
jgi:hypothetical protein